MHVYDAIARELRDQLDAGVYAPGAKLPAERVLAETFGVRRQTVNRAITELERSGYVRTKGRSGVFVVDRARPRQVLTIGREIGYDTRFGYIYNSRAGDWSPIGTPTRGRVELPPDIATRLEVPAGTSTLVRRRVVGADGEPDQVTTSYFAPELADRYDTADTGPGGWMQDAERELGLGPLTWRCAVSQRPPTPQEADDLDISPAGGVLVLTFTVRSALLERPLAVDVMVFDGLRFEVEYDVPRSRSATWPPPLATQRNAPPPPQ